MPFAGLGCDHRIELGAVGKACLVGSELLLAQQVLATKQSKQLAKQAVIRRRQHNFAIGNGKDAISAHLRVFVTHSRRVFARSKVMRCLAGQQADRAIQQRHIDMLPAASPLSHGKCGLDPDHRIEAAGQVRNRDPHLHRLARRLAGERHETAHRLDHEIVARLARARPRLAEAGYRTIDKAWIERFKTRKVEPEPRQRAGLEILQHHIRASSQFADAPEVVCILEIGDNAAFAAVGGVIIGRFAIALLALDPWRPPQAGAIASGAFDLDHIRAKIGKDLSGPWPSEHAGQFEDLQARQRGFGIARLIEPHAAWLAAAEPHGQVTRYPLCSPAR